MCTPPWSASRTCSCGPARGRTVPVLRSVPRWVSCTSTLCSPGLCCWPSAPAVKSKKYYKSETFCPQLFANLWGFFFAMFYSLTHILSCADFCPNFQGCWRVTMSIWGLLQEKQSLCFLSWPETWTRWVLFKGIPLSSSVCVLLSFICVRPNIFIPLFFFSCHRSLILTNWTNSATNWMHWPQTVTSTEPRRTRKSNDLCSGTFSRLLRWVGVRQIRFVGIWSQLAHGKNSLLFYRRATSSPRPFDLGPSVWQLTAGSERGCMMPSGSLWALEWTITCRCIF